MRVRFWGTRGSLPVAQKSSAIRDKVAAALVAANGRTFADADEARDFADKELEFATSGSYGGATSCVEIEASGDNDEAFIVCDLGSGLREFGLAAMVRCAGGHAAVYHVFLSHLHWDHIMGFPFFVPAFDPAAHIVIHSGHAQAEHALRRQQEDISFPVSFDHLRADISFRTLQTGRKYAIGTVTVEMIEQQHSNKSCGFKFTDAVGKSVVYSTDSEHKIDRIDTEAAVIDFFGACDLVICDTMYSLAESISMKEDWGHSSNLVAIDLCHEARARRLALIRRFTATRLKAISDCREAEALGEAGRLSVAFSMSSTPTPDDNPQLDKFKEAARALECDDDEHRFDEPIKKLVRHKPVEKSA